MYDAMQFAQRFVDSIIYRLYEMSMFSATFAKIYLILEQFEEKKWKTIGIPQNWIEST